MLSFVQINPGPVVGFEGLMTGEVKRNSGQFVAGRQISLKPLLDGFIVAIMVPPGIFLTLCQQLPVITGQRQKAGNRYHEVATLIVDLVFDVSFSWPAPGSYEDGFKW